MSTMAFDTLHLAGQRVLPPEQVQAMEQLRSLDASLRQGAAQTRQRLAARLRHARAAARRNGFRQGRLEGMREVAASFAEDVRQWRAVAARIEQVVATVLQDATLALPKALLMEMQLRKCFAEVRGAPDLRVHVNAATYQPVQDMMRNWIAEEQIVACEVVLTDYLPDGACILETGNGMFEGQVERELSVFCERVTALLRRDGAQL
jgi:flagellar biosynthesis/type III secretory pathway protein FliH